MNHALKANCTENRLSVLAELAPLESYNAFTVTCVDQCLGQKRYFVPFIDDYSRCCQVYFMRHKSEVLHKFKKFEALATNESGLSIGILRTDNEEEYVSKEFEEFLKSKGIRYELTIPYSPAQNGVAERLNRTLMESAGTMIRFARLPDSYWGEAVVTAAYIRNRVLTSPFKERVSPYEKWYQRRPDLSHLRVFGCVAYAYIPDCQRNKLVKKAEKFRFVGNSRDKEKGGIGNGCRTGKYSCCSTGNPTCSSYTLWYSSRTKRHC